MRTVHKTTAIVVALGIAFGVTACGADPKSISKGIAMSVDESLQVDLKNVATELESMGAGGGNAVGELAPTKPGGPIDLGSGSNQQASPGNVIAVKLIEKGYCISGYNKSATKATSATKALLYNSNKGGIQPGVGVC